MDNLRRIVTGHDEQGKSIIMIDGGPSRTIGEDVGGLFEIGIQMEKKLIVWIIGIELILK
tara:strand:+ start:5793 stop:5972 length:180 start_codon:yes stop_codon:yes gene_type:complete